MIPSAALQPPTKSGTLSGMPLERKDMAGMELRRRIQPIWNQRTAWATLLRTTLISL